VNPSLCVPVEDKRGEPIWGADPVHPKHEGYNRIVDFVCAEAARLTGKGSTKKRAATQDGPPGKKPRTEATRPVEMGVAVAVAEAGSTRVGEAGAARAPTASKCKQQSACRELFFFLCKITRKKM
jgi:hypothetical protein